MRNARFWQVPDRHRGRLRTVLAGADRPGRAWRDVRRVGGAGKCGSGPLSAPPNPSSGERTFLPLFSLYRVLHGGAGRDGGANASAGRRWGASAGTDVAGTASAATGVAGGRRAALIPDTSYSERTNAPERLRPMRERRTYGNKRRDLAGAGSFTAALGHNLPEHPLPTWDSDVITAWDGPGEPASRLRAGGWMLTGQRRVLTFLRLILPGW